MRIFMIAMLVAFLSAGNALAIDLGQNITSADLVGSGTGWYGAQEDQETEPGTTIGQNWDMEAFFLDGSILTMVGGYDFVNGEKDTDSGDIFIDIDHDAVYGPDNAGSGLVSTVENVFGYEYVVDLDFSDPDNLTYTVYSIDEETLVMTGDYKQESNPWRYVSGGEFVTSGDIGYITGLTDEDVGFAGDDADNTGTHNAASIDLSFLGEEAGSMTVHFTMECGNDNLMGTTPEPATMLLLGSGLMGLAGLRRRFKKS